MATCSFAPYGRPCPFTATVVVTLTGAGLPDEEVPTCSECLDGWSDAVQATARPITGEYRPFRAGDARVVPAVERGTVRSALRAHRADGPAAQLPGACEHSTGSATGCRPLCDAPATVATDHYGVRELLTSAHCDRHHRPYLNSLYPSLPVAVRRL